MNEKKIADELCDRITASMTTRTPAHVSRPVGINCCRSKRNPSKSELHHFVIHFFLVLFSSRRFIFAFFALFNISFKQISIQFQFHFNKNLFFFENFHDHK